MEHREAVLEQVGTFLDLRERQAELPMLQVVPTGAQADFDPATAHLVDGRDDFRQVAGVSERHGRDQGAQPDPVRVASETRDDRPGVGGRLAGGPGEARVVVGAEQGFEPVGFCSFGDGDLVAVAQALLGLDHQRETHHDSCMRHG
jgi:hypothetical protein